MRKMMTRIDDKAVKRSLMVANLDSLKSNQREQLLKNLH